MTEERKTISVVTRIRTERRAGETSLYIDTATISLPEGAEVTAGEKMHYRIPHGNDQARAG